jgi:ubiquinone/menaquinone biosynthesis C-methylase UbiE
MNSKEFYKTYIADSNLAALNYDLVELILNYNPDHVFEFGMGTGKHLYILHNKYNIVTAGLDVSFNNVIKGYGKHELPFIIYGDETHLRHLCNFDIVFTCSVLDHIKDIAGIIAEFKRIANKAVFLAETQYLDEDNHYYKHIYEDYGFVDIGGEWINEKPNGDGNIYRIWKWIKP